MHLSVTQRLYELRVDPDTRWLIFDALRLACGLNRVSAPQAIVDVCPEGYQLNLAHRVPSSILPLMVNLVNEEFVAYDIGLRAIGVLMTESGNIRLIMEVSDDD